jgi:hypothetical protein
VRILLTTTALVLILAAGPAAALDGGLGVQVTAASNSLTGSLPNEGKWQGRSGFGAGIMADLNFAPDITLSFQPEYTPRNSRQEFKFRNVVVGYVDYEFSYLNLPLLVRVTGEPAGVRGFVTAGLEYSILLDATLEAGDGTVDISDELQGQTFGALLGAGAMVPVGKNFLLFELRYVQGLGDMVERDPSETESTFTSPSVKYRGFHLKAGFLLSLGGG